MLTKIIQLALHSLALARFLPLFLFGATVYAQAPLNKISVVHSFTGGADPSGPLIELPNGNFAGMTFGVGNNLGKQATVFTMTPNGAVTTLYTFTDYTEGGEPDALLLASDGNFYGTCGRGGLNKQGTLFQVSPSGVYTQLYSFPVSGGFFGPDSLLEGPDGYLYGVSGGGTTGFGAIFRYGLKSRQTTLFYSFFPGFVGPTQPYGEISLGPDGRFYGSTNGYYSSEGVYSPGAAYVIDPSGNFSTLAVYDYVIGGAYNAPFFPGDGYAYFAGNVGGNNSSCLNGCGSIYRVAMDGSEANLVYSFANGADGYAPQNVSEGSDGLFYGYNSTSIANGAENTIFQVNAPAGTGTTFAFPASAGFAYQVPMFQSVSGVFRGVSQHGSLDGAGAAFILNVGAPPVPPLIYGFSLSEGSPGTTVTVWGANFVLLRDVALNGTAGKGVATSAQFVRFVVPDLASTGPITIATAGGSAVSAAAFTVQ